ncbi:MAG: VOC family protein [Dehalococcoidales bacterium]|nr:VOC family protein [Dehalococcoidales bacterium]
MPTIVHFDIAADDTERAKKFYEALFDWKIEGPPGMTDYYLIETSGLDGERGIGGGLGKKGEPNQKITSYIGVDSVDVYASKIEQLGGKVVQSKIAVPGWGYMAICIDTENNIFGLWQEDNNAK